jgi:hypothetical protein
MRFLRVTGPHIALDDVFNDLASDDSSSSLSSDSTSAIDEDYARFLAAQSRCTTISIFHRRGIPRIEPAPLPPLAQTVVIDKDLLIPRTEEHPVSPTGLELVPWKSCYPTLLLGYLPVVLFAVR